MNEVRQGTTDLCLVDVRLQGRELEKRAGGDGDEPHRLKQAFLDRSSAMVRMMDNLLESVDQELLAAATAMLEMKKASLQEIAEVFEAEKKEAEDAAREECEKYLTAREQLTACLNDDPPPLDNTKLLLIT